MIRALWHRHRDAILVFAVLCLFAAAAGAADGWVSR